MAGTRDSARLAAKTMKRRFGDRYFATIGAIGGRVENSSKSRLVWDEELNHVYPEYAEMFRLRNENPKQWTYQALSNKFGRSRQNIHNILNPKKGKLEPDVDSKHE